MKAFDADILTEILAGNPAYAERLAAAPPGEQAVPIVVIEELIRGRLNTIHQAEAGGKCITIEQAYSLLEQTLDGLRHSGMAIDADYSQSTLRGVSPCQPSHWEKPKRASLS